MFDDEAIIGGGELSGTDAPESGIAEESVPATILRAMSDAGLAGDLALGDTHARVERDLRHYD